MKKPKKAARGLSVRSFKARYFPKNASSARLYERYYVAPGLIAEGLGKRRIKHEAGMKRAAKTGDVIAAFFHSTSAAILQEIEEVFRQV